MRGQVGRDLQSHRGEDAQHKFPCSTNGMVGYSVDRRSYRPSQETKHGRIQEPLWGTMTPTVLAMAEDTKNDVPVIGSKGSAIKEMCQGWDPGEIHKVKEGACIVQGVHTIILQSFIGQNQLKSNIYFPFKPEPDQGFEFPVPD